MCKARTNETHVRSQSLLFRCKLFVRGSVLRSEFFPDRDFFLVREACEMHRGPRQISLRVSGDFQNGIGGYRGLLVMALRVIERAKRHAEHGEEDDEQQCPFHSSWRIASRYRLYR